MSNLKKKIILCALTLLLAGTLWAQMVVPTINASGGSGTVNPGSLSGLYCLLTGCTIDPGPLVVLGNFEVGVGFVEVDNVSLSVGIGALPSGDATLPLTLGGGILLGPLGAGSCGPGGVGDGTLQFNAPGGFGEFALCDGSVTHNLWTPRSACGVATLGNIRGTWGTFGITVTTGTNCNGVVGDCTDLDTVQALELFAPSGIAIGACTLTAPGAAIYHEHCSGNGALQNQACIEMPSGHGAYFACPSAVVAAMTEYTLCASFIPAGESMKNAVVASMTGTNGGVPDTLSGIIVADYLKNSALASPPGGGGEVRSIASNQNNAGLQTICMSVDTVANTMNARANGWNFVPGDVQLGVPAPTAPLFLQIGGGDSGASPQPDFVGALVAIMVFDRDLGGGSCYASQMGEFNRGSL